MGIAYAFVKGLVQGANSFQAAKSEERAQEAADEKERLNSLGTIVFDAIKAGTLDPVKGADFLSRPEDQQTRAALAAMMVQVSEMGSKFGYNALQFNKPEKWDEDLRSDNQLRSGGAWLNFFNSRAVNTEERARMKNHFMQNSGDWEAFINDFEKYNFYHIQGQREPGEGSTEFKPYAEPSDLYKPLFGFVDEINNALAAGTQTSPEKAAQTVENTVFHKEIDSAHTFGFIENKENSFVFKYRTPEGESKLDVFEFKDQNQIDALGRLASNLGYSADRNGIKKLIANFSDVAQASSGEEAYSLLINAVDMERRGFGALSQTLGGNDQLRAEFATYIEEEFGGNYKEAIKAYAPLMKLKEDDVPKVGNIPIKYARPERDDYFERNKLDREQIVEQYESSKESLAQLAELERLVRTGTGIKAAMQQLGFGIFGEGGQIDQIFGNFVLDEGTTTQSLASVAVDGGFLSVEAAKKLSEIDALKLSLAAQMARAVDPSGRLSNQDFEIQLQRLGQSGFFTSTVQAEASLGVVISEFKRRQRRLEILAEVAAVGAGEFGDREARILKADRIIRSIETANYKEKASQRGPATTDDGTPKKELTLDEQLGFYTDGTSYFYDAEGTKPVPQEEIMRKLGMG